MTIEKTFQGAWKITKNFFTMQYFGYTKKEAMKLFKKEYEAQNV